MREKERKREREKEKEKDLFSGGFCTSWPVPTPSGTACWELEASIQKKEQRREERRRKSKEKVDELQRQKKKDKGKISRNIRLFFLFFPWDLFTKLEMNGKVFQDSRWPLVFISFRFVSSWIQWWFDSKESQSEGKNGCNHQNKREETLPLDLQRRRQIMRMEKTKEERKEGGRGRGRGRGREGNVKGMWREREGKEKGKEGERGQWCDYNLNRIRQQKRVKSKWKQNDP